MPFISFEVDEKLMAEIQQAVAVEKQADPETDRSKMTRNLWRAHLRDHMLAVRPTDADPDAQGVVNLTLCGTCGSKKVQK